jgi:hypothetical protein
MCQAQQTANSSTMLADQARRCTQRENRRRFREFSEYAAYRVNLSLETHLAAMIACERAEDRPSQAKAMEGFLEANRKRSCESISARSSTSIRSSFEIQKYAAAAENIGTQSVPENLVNERTRKCSTRGFFTRHLGGCFSL